MHMLVILESIAVKPPSYGGDVVDFLKYFLYQRAKRGLKKGLP